MYLPAIKTPDERLPVVIVVHGGGWSAGSKDTMKMVSESLVANGFAVFNINYRLAPHFLHPTPSEDLELAYRFLREHADRYNLDMQRVSLWGYSAGGHIVSYFSLKNSKQKNAEFPIRAVVAGGAPYDLTWYPKSEYSKIYLGTYRDEAVEKYIEASPISHVSKEAPPFLLYHAVQDELVVHPQATAFEFKMKMAGAHVERFDVGYWGHKMTVAMSEEANLAGVKFLQRINQNEPPKVVRLR